MVGWEKGIISVTETPSEPVEDFILKQTATVQPIVRALRDRIWREVPDLMEFIDGWGNLRFGHNAAMNGWLMYISAHKAHANLGFAKGSSLPDPDGIIEGTGKNLRHVKVRSVAEAENPALQRLIVAAGGLGP